MIKAARAARKCFQYIPHLLMDCLRKRARAARKNVSRYTSSAYGLRKKKGARSAEIFSKLNSCFSILLTNRPESVCVGKMQSPVTEKVCVGKMQNPGHPKGVCG